MQFCTSEGSLTAPGQPQEASPPVQPTTPLALRQWCADSQLSHHTHFRHPVPERQRQNHISSYETSYFCPCHWQQPNRLSLSKGDVKRSSKEKNMVTDSSTHELWGWRIKHIKMSNSGQRGLHTAGKLSFFAPAKAEKKNPTSPGSFQESLFPTITISIHG